MRQRLALARCLMRAPALILLDEPYAGLDGEARIVVDDLLTMARATGQTVIVASHEAPPAHLVDREVTMDGGQLAAPPLRTTAATAPPTPGRSRRHEPAGRPGDRRQGSADGDPQPVHGEHGPSVRGHHAARVRLRARAGPAAAQPDAPGLLWLAALFASVELCHRSYQTEAANGALEGLLLSPADKGAVYLGKAAAAFVQLIILLLVTPGLVVVLFGLPVGPAPGLLLLTAVLGIAGLSTLGSLLGLLAVRSRTRQAALPLLVLPLVSPVIIAATKRDRHADAGRAPTGSAGG